MLVGFIKIVEMGHFEKLTWGDRKLLQSTSLNEGLMADKTNS